MISVTTTRTRNRNRKSTMPSRLLAVFVIGVSMAFSFNALLPVAEARATSIEVVTLPSSSSSSISSLQKNEAATDVVLFLPPKSESTTSSFEEKTATSKQPPKKTEPAVSQNDDDDPRSPPSSSSSQSTTTESSFEDFYSDHHNTYFDTPKPPATTREIRREILSVIVFVGVGFITFLGFRIAIGAAVSKSKKKKGDMSAQLHKLQRRQNLQRQDSLDSLGCATEHTTTQEKHGRSSQQHRGNYVLSLLKGKFRRSSQPSSIDAASSTESYEYEEDAVDAFLAPVEFNDPDDSYYANKLTLPINNNNNTPGAPKGNTSLSLIV